ncbi:hypothetical protein lerEdw1_009724 [Lerista edwardsae]|nr:hypothetical protein lerEdw1_009724 [Lerista edwardsae]
MWGLAVFILNLFIEMTAMQAWLTFSLLCPVETLEVEQEDSSCKSRVVGEEKGSPFQSCFLPSGAGFVHVLEELKLLVEHVFGLCPVRGRGVGRQDAVARGIGAAAVETGSDGYCYHISTGIMVGIVAGDIALTLLFLIPVYYCARRKGREPIYEEPRKEYINMAGKFK